MALLQFAPSASTIVPSPLSSHIFAPFPQSSPVRHVGKDEQIFIEGDEARYFYQITEGAVRTFKLLSDGRRQIDAFHLPGDFIGFEAGAEFSSTAEALVPTGLVSYRRCRFSGMIAQDPDLANLMMAGMLGAVERAQAHMMVLGRKTALERIATFLGLMVERCGGRVIDLPMSRMDIADHLGLTIETVSRSMTELERRDIIHIPAHRRTIFVRNRLALADLAN